MVNSRNLLSLPDELLITLPNYLHDIEDYTNLGSTCRRLRNAMSAAKPNQILHLAAEASRTFFRPSPHFLVMATARELGEWVRASQSNEAVFVNMLPEKGIDGMLELALQHCGISMERIRDLYEKRFSIINSVTDIMDKCVGEQWYRTPDFWDGGVSDAYTIHAEPAISFFHLAIYGELFSPDFDASLEPSNTVRRLSVDTRLEFVKYCIPDYATSECQDSAWNATLPNGKLDPRRECKRTGVYANREQNHKMAQNNIGLTWIINSSRWKPHWKPVREAVGQDFGEVDDHWHETTGDWKQRMWEARMMEEGMDGYEMMLEQGTRNEWVTKVKDWRDKIAKLEKEPNKVHVGTQWTYEYPWLMGDLRILSTGYVSGT